MGVQELRSSLGSLTCTYALDHDPNNTLIFAVSTCMIVASQSLRGDCISTLERSLKVQLRRYACEDAKEKEDCRAVCRHRLTLNFQPPKFLGWNARLSLIVFDCCVEVRTDIFALLNSTSSIQLKKVVTNSQFSPPDHGIQGRESCGRFAEGVIHLMEQCRHC
jgi:hypothetical protein